MNNVHSKYWYYYYNYDDAELMRFMNSSFSEKIEWLDDFLGFLESAMTDEAKEIWMKFRSGELKYPIDKENDCL